jgi:hypothetical protein
VEEVPVLGREENQLVKQFLAQYDAPAYVRRARQVQDAFEQLLHRCRRQRDEWLTMVRMRLGRLKALAGDWEHLLPWLENAAQARGLADLHAALQPRLRVAVPLTTVPRVLSRALADLVASIVHFNVRWQEYLRTVDLTTVNELRDRYNRYYLLEKECAVRSTRLARQGFVRLEPLTLDELTEQLPPLLVPRLSKG